MKILLSLLFCFIGLLSYAQDIDKNGRPVGSVPSFAVDAVENDVYLRKDKEKSSASGLAVAYSLPAGNNAGKMVLFHPKRDLELMTITLNSNNGTVIVDTKALGFEGFSVGMYLSDDTFVQSQLIQ